MFLTEATLHKRRAHTVTRSLFHPMRQGVPASTASSKAPKRTTTHQVQCLSRPSNKQGRDNLNGSVYEWRKSNNTLCPPSKWKQIYDLFHLKNVDKCEDHHLTGLRVYRMMASAQNLARFSLKINFPETIIEVDGEQILIRTNEMGLVENRKIQKDAYLHELKEAINKKMKKLREYPPKYKKYCDFEHNINAPVIITKVGEEKDRRFEVQVESYKNFTEWRSKPNILKVVQRFILPRNMRALVFRLVFRKNVRGEQRQEYMGYRFQNVDEVLRQNKKNPDVWETFTNQAIINISMERPNKATLVKVTNINGLSKFIPSAVQLRGFLEKVNRIQINYLEVDFIVDPFDVPWLINVQRVGFQQETGNLVDRVGSVANEGICKLCSNAFLRNCLTKTISNKMLVQFLAHLKKRMKVEEYQKFCFVKDILKTHTNTHITFQVCEGCYKVVTEEFRLIECEKKLSIICNISPKVENLLSFTNNDSNNVKKLIQWRVMVFLSDLYNVPPGFLKGTDEVCLHSSFGPTGYDEESWNLCGQVSVSSGNFHKASCLNVKVNKLKVFYVHSESMDIKQFLKESQLNLKLCSFSETEPFAQGSSTILSNFRNNFEINSGIRQTSSILMFYESGRYCEIAVKVGLICDGNYYVPDNFKLTSYKQVYFSERSFVNSNPIPQEWMEAFGVNYQLNEEKMSYSEIMRTKANDDFILMTLQSDPTDSRGKSQHKTNGFLSCNTTPLKSNTKI